MAILSVIYGLPLHSGRNIVFNDTAATVQQRCFWSLAKKGEQRPIQHSVFLLVLVIFLPYFSLRIPSKWLFFVYSPFYSRFTFRQTHCSNFEFTFGITSSQLPIGRYKMTILSRSERMQAKRAPDYFFPQCEFDEISHFRTSSDIQKQSNSFSSTLAPPYVFIATYSFSRSSLLITISLNFIFVCFFTENNRIGRYYLTK